MNAAKLDPRFLDLERQAQTTKLEPMAIPPPDEASPIPIDDTPGAYRRRMAKERDSHDVK
jgi:hypothetical protein